jgi:hypothetical protein
MYLSAFLRTAFDRRQGHACIVCGRLFQIRIRALQQRRPADPRRLPAGEVHHDGRWGDACPACLAMKQREAVEELAEGSA